MSKKYDHHTHKPLQGEHKPLDDDTSLSANKFRVDRTASPYSEKNRELYDYLEPDQIAWLGRFHRSRANTPQAMQPQNRFKKYLPLLLKAGTALVLGGAGFGAGYLFNRYKNSKRREQGNQSSGRSYLPTPTPMPTPPPVNMSNVLAGN